MTDSQNKTPCPSLAARLRNSWAFFWLGIFFWFADHAEPLLAILRTPICAAAFWCSPSIRRGTRANARRLLGPASSRVEQDQLAMRVVGSFYLFCCDVAKSQQATTRQLLDRVESISGKDAYLKARALHRGLIVVTAHMGSFEVAMATLRSMEERIHVIFRRDAVGRFERQRAELRQRLGIIEEGLEEGWPVWIKLREALRADEVVVIQGDRVLPGQKGQAIPFLNGHVEFPASPITLAMVSGAPILPIFSIRTPENRIRLLIEEPIFVPLDSAVQKGRIHPSLSRLAEVVQRQIVSYPDQWLLLESAWLEDRGDAG
jgi:phosphatidylinositol dimannoside acyltransferase